MKKLLALLLVVVMALGMVACAGDDNTDVRVTVSVPDSVIQTEVRKNSDFYPLETDTVLRVLFTEDGLGDIDASNLWERVTGVQVENLTWNNEQMMTCLAAGDIPDAIVMPWDLSKEQVYEFGIAGKFLDFSQHLEKMPNLCALIREYPEIMEVCGYPNGAMYSLPKVGWSNTYQSNLFYIRTDILEDLGWEKAPATTDELLQFLKEAQEANKGNPAFVGFMPQNNTYMKWNGMNTISGFLFPSFGELLDTNLNVNKEGEIVLGAATEQYRYYLEYMNELWTSGAFATEIYTMDSTASRAIVRNGNCAVSSGTYAEAKSFSDGISHVTVMEPLTSKYQGVKQWKKTPVVNYRGCVANANCEDLDTLLAWLDSFYAPEDNCLNKEGTVYGASLAKGELGVNWTMDHENKTWDSGASFTNYYDNLYSGVYGNYIPQGDLKLKGQGTNESLLPYAKEPFNFDKLVLSQDEQDNYADIWTDMEKYISTMHGKFITGQEDLETGWDNYLNQLKKMGLEEILEIYQDVYDESKK